MVNQEVKWLKYLPKLIVLMDEVAKQIQDSRHSIWFQSGCGNSDSSHLLICKFQRLATLRNWWTPE